MILLTAVPAFLQGRFLNRWGEPPNLRVAGQQLHQLPRQLGGWQSAADQRPLSEAVCRELGLVEHFHRQYVHSESGERLDVLLMVGPSGRLVRHPPEVCYANRANQQVGGAFPLEIAIESIKHQFKLLHFRQISQPVQSDFWVAYAFATNEGSWTAPKSPRMAFGGAPVLYKLQVLTEVSEQGDHEEVSDFLEKFIAAFPIVITDDVAKAEPLQKVER